MIEAAAEHGWELRDSDCGGCTAAVKGTEIHVEFHRQGVVLRDKVRRFLAPLLGREGFLTTRVAVNDRVHDAFVRRLGFSSTWSDGTFQYYILTALPFSKEH